MNTVGATAAEREQGERQSAAGATAAEREQGERQ